MYIETEHFTLAVNVGGNKHASKLALILPGRLDTKDYAHMKAHVAYLAERGF